jgi:hypothetical protein
VKSTAPVEESFPTASGPETAEPQVDTTAATAATDESASAEKGA